MHCIYAKHNAFFQFSKFLSLEFSIFLSRVSCVNHVCLSLLKKKVKKRVFLWDVLHSRFRIYIKHNAFLWILLIDFKTKHNAFSQILQINFKAKHYNLYKGFTSRFHFLNLEALKSSLTWVLKSLTNSSHQSLSLLKIRIKFQNLFLLIVITTVITYPAFLFSDSTS